MARGMVSRGAKETTMPPDQPDPHYDWTPDVEGALWKAVAGFSVLAVLAGIGLAALVMAVWGWL